MKKTIILAVFALLYTTSAFAAATSATATALAFGGSEIWGAKGASIAAIAGAPSALIGKTSTGVGFGWKTDPGGYGVVTQHINGSKVFGSSFDSTSVYTKPVTKIGTAETVTLTTGIDSFPTSGTWTTM